METMVIGANAQMPVSAQEKYYLEQYEGEMIDAHAAPELFEFLPLSDKEKLEWIRVNDTEYYNKFINQSAENSYGN